MRYGKEYGKEQAKEQVLGSRKVHRMDLRNLFLTSNSVEEDAGPVYGEEEFRKKVWMENRWRIQRWIFLVFLYRITIRIL